MSHLLTLEEFEAQCNSQIEVAEDAYGPWMMRVHMRRWRYQQLYPHLPLARPDQDWMMFLDLVLAFVGCVKECEAWLCDVIQLPSSNIG